MKDDEQRKQVLFTVGESVRKYRVQKGWSQEKLAEITNLHRTYIGSVERGEKNVTISNLVKISQSLDVDLNDIYSDDHHKQ